MRQQEHKLQVAFVRWLRYQHPNVLGFAVPNGGHRNKIVAAKLKAEGVLVGVPDFFIEEPRGPWHGLRIEFKRPGVKRATAAQVEVAEKMDARGYCWALVNDLDGAIAIVNEYLDLRWNQQLAATDLAALQSEE